MSTRTIVTSQPDVACELCARRLLRGETHEVFIADGRPRNVCELCAPRAADAGWIRESDGGQALTVLSSPRRGRGIFERLRRGRGEHAPPRRSGDSDDIGYPADASDPQLDVQYGAQLEEDAPAAPPGWVERTPAPRELNEPVRAAAATLDPYGRLEPLETRLQRAAEVFNDSEFPRRVAALARSLGAPGVCLRAAEHLDSAVRITVAWELCWYRYEVDLSEETPLVRALAQGTELGQLPREERIFNAQASPSGTLAPA